MQNIDKKSIFYRIKPESFVVEVHVDVVFQTDRLLVVVLFVVCSSNLLNKCNKQIVNMFRNSNKPKH